MSDVASIYRNMLKDGVYPDTVFKLADDHMSSVFRLLKEDPKREAALDLKIAWADLGLFLECEVQPLIDTNLDRDLDNLRNEIGFIQS